MVSSISCSHRGEGKWDHAEPLSTPNRCSVIYIWPGSILKYPKNQPTLPTEFEETDSIEILVNDIFVVLQRYLHKLAC